MSGATGNPAILAFASRTAPTDRPDVGYAMIFPSMTIGKILFIQIAATLLTLMTTPFPALTRSQLRGPHEDCRVQRPAL